MGDPGQDARLHAPATERNRDPILAILRRVLPPGGLVLEVASGTGQHAVHFASALPEITWQPSDPDPGARASIDAWREHAAPPNLRPAVAVDVTRHPWPIDRADALVCINMIHISPWACTEALLQNAVRLLPPEGILFTYGPYKREGRHTSPSNEAFDRSLRDRDPSWGVRDVDEVAGAAGGHGFVLAEVHPMPANNLSLVFRLG